MKIIADSFDLKHHTADLFINHFTFMYLIVSHPFLPESSLAQVESWSRRVSSSVGLLSEVAGCEVEMRMADQANVNVHENVDKFSHT